MSITENQPDRTARHAGAWALLAGGALFFVGGGMHPHDDPPDVTLREHLHVMFDNPAWYPAHAVLLLGMACMTVGLVVLVRQGPLQARPERAAGLAAAVTAGLGTAGMLVHLFSALDADRLASGGSTPLVDLHLVTEAITVPAFGLAVAWLAVVGTATRTLGNRLTAVAGVVGGVAYALAGATFLVTDALDPLFPLAGAIGLWAAGAAIGLLRSPVASPVPAEAGVG